MNGIHIDFNQIVGIKKEDNLFELRKKIYNNLIDRVIEHIDSLYDRLVGEEKAEEIQKRTIKSNIDKESLVMLYKGVEIPLMDKNCITLDNIDYIPIFQMVDKPIHLQKNGEYIVVKNNVRNTFLKLDGKVCNVLYKNAQIPLLAFLLYKYKTILDCLVDLGYTIVPNFNNIDPESDNYYLVPEYYNNTFIIVKKDFEEGSWKEYFLSPFKKENFEYHQAICNNIIDHLNNDIIPDILDENGNNDNSIYYKDIKNKSDIDKEIAEKRESRENVDEKNARDYILVQHKDNEEELSRAFLVINTYHIKTRTVKKSLTKVYLETSLFKYDCKDITMNNLSVFNMIIDNIKENRMIPACYNIADISQKNLRFLEWYCLKLSSVRSYPEQNLIIEVAKTEPKRIYNNSVNPISELCTASRVNLFGKGALPIESCNVKIRNLHDSYYGSLDSIDSPSGRNIGISLHLCPEVNSTDMENEVNRLRNDNIFNKLYDLQK